MKMSVFMHHQGFVPSWPCWLLYHLQTNLSVCTQLWYKVPAWPCLATTLLLIKFVCLSCLYVCLHVSPTAPLWPFLPSAFLPDKFVCVCVHACVSFYQSPIKFVCLCSCMCTFVSITQQVCPYSCMCKFLSITQQVCLYMCPYMCKLLSVTWFSSTTMFGYHLINRQVCLSDFPLSHHLYSIS